jgi:hypothetical protein
VQTPDSCRAEKIADLSELQARRYQAKIIVDANATASKPDKVLTRTSDIEQNFLSSPK